MRKILLTAMVTLVCGGVALGLSPQAKADSNPRQILSLSQDAPSYIVGSRAVLTAYVQILPKNPNYEFYVTSQFAGQDIKIERLTDAEAFSVTPQLTAPGSFSWAVNVYIQNRRTARNLVNTISFYEHEIDDLRGQLAYESDPGRIKQLQDQISRDQGLMAKAQRELAAGRRLLEQDTLTITVNATTPYTLAVNAGGATYTGTDGTVWNADAYFTGGTPYSSSMPVTGTSDSALYQTVRYGSAFSYTFSVPNGTYSITLKFAEVYWTSAGGRVFNVAINGSPVLQNFDIFAEAHGANIALDKTFQVAVNSGQIVINFTAVTDNADVSGVRIVQTGK